jgi:hypothetical protein
VDGQPAKLLNCNYIMRGVYLAAGPHQVEFRFQPPMRTLYLSLAVLGLGAVLLGFVSVSGFRQWASAQPMPAATGPGPGPQAPRKQGSRKNGREARPAAVSRPVAKP